jgi:uracil-DNA glycosylase family 4
MRDPLNDSYIVFLKKSGIGSFLQEKPRDFYIPDSKKMNSLTLKIGNISSVDELEFFIKQSNICDLKNHAKHTVIGDGNTQADIMLIGEAPGAEEDKIGKPFVGAAGQLLNKMLSAINLDRNKVYITNVIPWRPPNNRTPSNEEILQCLPFLQKHIELIKPKLIVLLGAIAAKSVLSTPLGISKLRGHWHEYKSLHLNESILCLATYHPAFLLRSPGFKKIVWEDLQKLQKKIENESL